jgi:hypothetical protein
MNKNTSQGKILILFTHFSCILPHDSAGRFARELWWTNQELFSVDVIIPLWFSILIHHLGDEQ